MNDPKQLKEITYSSEYVAELERKLALAQKKSKEVEHDKWLLDCTASYYLEVYKQALKQAIGDAMPFVSDWSLMIAEGYEEYAELFRECINDKSSIEGIAMFYFMLVAKNKDKEEWSKRK
jgi:hypothetical protein